MKAHLASSVSFWYDFKIMSDLVGNKKAFYEFEILETFEAGIMLQGTEIKSLRTHDASLQEAYVKVLNDELWLIGSYIAPYKFGNIHNHVEKRDRKLLMHRDEIRKLEESTRIKGLTAIPADKITHRKIGLQSTFERVLA